MASYRATMKRTLSITLATGSLTVAAASPRRARVFGLILGSEAAPADNAIDWQVQRCTSAGTAGSNPTVILDDTADIAQTVVVGQAHSVNPAGLTAPAIDVPQNQRATWTWEVDQNSPNVIVLPATNSNGIAIMTPTINAVGQTPIITASARWAE